MDFFLYFGSVSIDAVSVRVLRQVIKQRTANSRYELSREKKDLQGADDSVGLGECDGIHTRFYTKCGLGLIMG